MTPHIIGHVDAPAAERGGGVDEELLFTLVADGVPRNQAVQIAAAALGRDLSLNQVLFLGSLTTDASGRFILNTFPAGIPIGGGTTQRPGTGSTIADVVDFVQTSQGSQFVDDLVREEVEFNDSIQQYEENFAQLEVLTEELGDLQGRDLSSLDDASRAIFQERIDAKRGELSTLGTATLEIVSSIAPGIVPQEDAVGNITVPRLTSEDLGTTQLGDLQGVTATAPRQTTGARATGAFVPRGGLTPVQAATVKVAGAEESRIQAEIARQTSETQRRAREETIFALNRRGTTTFAQRPSFAETVGTLPAGAGSPAFRGFVERAGPTLRQQVEGLAIPEQLPFLRRRFAALGPQARGDFPARFAPPARTLIRR